MNAPHTVISERLETQLGTSWNVRTGDRPLDGLANKPTAVVYTERITQPSSVSRLGVFQAEMTVLAIPVEVAADKTETALFNALAEILLALDFTTETFTLDSAERVIYQDRPAFQLRLIFHFNLTLA